MKVYFIRHGESDANKVSVHQRKEVQLSKRGTRQASSMAQRLKKLDVDIIYSSDYVRAKQTAKFISKILDRPIEYWKDLREIKNPSEIIGLEYSDPLSIKIRGKIQKNFLKGNWKYSDEENFNEIKARGEKVLAHLVENHKNQNIVCVSHGTIIKLFLSLMIFGDKLTPEIYLLFRFHLATENTGITVCEYTDEYGWGILTFNDVAHL